MGYFQPGTKVQVGNHRVVVEKYLSEGGFAHVYVVRVPSAGGLTELAVLKRVAVPDKEALASMRTEVETMKKLKGHKHIVTYIDSHASQLKGGGYEVFLLMEYCDGGGLIDFMNTRLKDRLTEPEILKIFSDACEGLACMHYLKPPLLHRDLKVENILITRTSSGKLYKLCDFGSTAPPRPAATSVVEGKLIEDDVQRHTTLQYRSPEMIDVYRKQPIDEKSDVWALGVLLYKLCYYTTPFEEQGQMAILIAKFRYPPYPKFSDRLKKLIAEMLMEDPKKRPNIYQVLAEVCSMRGREVPVKDIYSARTASDARDHQRLPSPVLNVKSPAALDNVRVPIEQTKQPSEITPMRRGRPVSPSKQLDAGTATAKRERDPFAALDSPSFDTRSRAVDELSSRFPPSNQFAILQSQRKSFDFEGTSAEGTPVKKTNLSDKLTNALADQAFATSTPRRRRTPSPPHDATPRTATAVSLRKAASPPRIETIPRPSNDKPLPMRPSANFNGTTAKPDSLVIPSKPPPISDRPIWRVPTPNEERADSREPPARPRLADRARPSSQYLDRSTFETSRPSLDRLRPPALDVPRSLHRSRSADEPTLSPTKTERMKAETETYAARDKATGHRHEPLEYETAVDDTNLSSVDYLRSLETEGALPARGSHRRSSSMFRHLKHASMPISSGSKNMFGGKFGNAFRRFEAGGTGGRRTSSKEDEAVGQSKDRPVGSNDIPRSFSPSNNVLTLVETEELPPEMRRELERRRLSLEERRVADVAAAHRASIASGNRAGPNRASAIQTRVKNLLDESGRTSPAKKTAHGYGKYTEDEDSRNSMNYTAPVTIDPHQASQLRQMTPEPARYQPSPAARQSIPQVKQRHPEAAMQPPSASASPTLAPIKHEKPVARPPAPTKPAALQSKAIDPRAVITDPSELDWQYDFSTRYPDLSLDLVESDIVGKQTPPRTTSLRVKDV